MLDNGLLFLTFIIISYIAYCGGDVQVEIKRTIPRGSTQSQDFKTSKIFVGGILPTLTEGNTFFFFHIKKLSVKNIVI